MQIETLTVSSFRPFGCLIGYPQKHKKSLRHNLFRIVLADKTAPGWRIAYLIVRDKSILRLEQHPFSFESFEPMAGQALLFVAKSKRHDAIRCFRLNQPIIVNKGVWHGVVTTGAESEIKLTENARVKCVYWRLGFRLPSVSTRNLKTK